MSADLDAHLATGTTRVARCWKVTRRDGVTYGFTDHDKPLVFEGVTFKADTGLSAAAVMQTTGLSVDNTEAVGALSDASVTEEDIAAGRFDGAAVEAWLVQWDAPENRALQFRGSFGEITRGNGAFTVELRGLAEQLNAPTGRVYHATSPVMPGDPRFGVDVSGPGYTVQAEIGTVEDGRVFTFADVPAYESGWFERGRFRVLSGLAQGLEAAIKIDRVEGDVRRVELWDRLRAPILPGDRVEMQAGFDGSFEAARLKFGNAIDFRGYPDIPGEDWQAAHPSRVSNRQGGSRR